LREFVDAEEDAVFRCDGGTMAAEAPPVRARCKQEDGTRRNGLAEDSKGERVRYGEKETEAFTFLASFSASFASTAAWIALNTFCPSAMNGR
jgi:hypothetical protein